MITSSLPFRYPNLEQRLLAGSVLDLDTDCWLWLRNVSNRYGRITLWIDGRTRVRWVHRVAYAEWRGPIPAGWTVEHECRVTLCINPAHLSLLSNSDNARRAAVIENARRKNAKTKPMDRRHA